ncbi:hypothetical protein Avbf_09938 [Armadillidium vulgare]|nr:hypothetical protein Avbf_09938 [Armadillidium vulgare]
MYMQPS